MKIYVGSKNPVKIDAVGEAFRKYFPQVEIDSKETPSGVHAQPVNDDVFLGAYNRAKDLTSENADYYVGIEGGILKQHGCWFLTTIVCIIDKEGKAGYGIGPGIEMPQSFVDEMLSGVELGIIADRLAGHANMKQQGGITEILTKGITKRKDPTVQAVIRALVPFINKELYTLQ
jgi:inosine/xanthosine triphosphatase